MTDILGPANAVGAVTTRPVDERTYGALDSWFADCTSATAEDGTDIRASWYNGITAALRSLWRSNGKLADNVTPVVAELGSADDALVRAVQYLIQRGQAVFAVDTGTASALVVSLAPAAVEYKDGLSLRVVAKYGPTGPSTINVNGLGVVPIIHTNTLAPTAAGEWVAESVLDLTLRNGSFRLTSASEGRPTLNASRTYYVQAAPAGNDANDGLTTGTPFATWQHAADTIKKLNLNGWAVTVQGLGGTYSAGCGVAGPFFGGGAVTFVGSGDLIVTPSGCAFESDYGAEFSVGAGITVQSTDAANGAIKAQFGGTINISGDVHFNACTGFQIGALDGGNIRLRSGYTVNGGGAAHIQLQGQGRVTVDTAGPITPGFGPGIHYGGAFLICRSLSYALLGAYHPSASSVTGARYAVGGNAVIDVQGQGPTFLPGDAAGINDDGTGVYQ
jgi:hypothetical protein